jgi:hypothetical protein
MTNKTYTQDQLDIEIIKNNQNHLFKILERLESHQKWMLGLMGSGFIGLLGLMAHGFKWIN